MDKEKVILLGARKYDFANQETGEIIKGCNVFYSTLKQENDENLVGSVANKVSLPYDEFQKYQSIKYPSIAEMSYSLSFSGRNPRINVDGFKVIEELPVK